MNEESKHEKLVKTRSQNASSGIFKQVAVDETEGTTGYLNKQCRNSCQARNVGKQVCEKERIKDSSAFARFSVLNGKAGKRSALTFKARAFVLARLIKALRDPHHGFTLIRRAVALSSSKYADIVRRHAVCDETCHDCSEVVGGRTCQATC